jgi:CDP-glucose 4,6-dehydratase
MFEKKNLFLKDYKNLKVLVTGSTGFKGTWLSFLLHKFGANVIGVGLKPEKNFKLFDKLKLKKKITQYIANIEDYKIINKIIKKESPAIIFHLAAQSIVSESFENPLKTISTNVLGSTNILEAVRVNQIKALVYITSDKCYLNKGSKRSYKENDYLGGVDNYSSSKASAEILFHSYYESFFKNNTRIHAGTARAGNVIGGGDFKNDRIIPDFFRAISQKKTLIIRNPKATRPWQHVLEPLSGYLKLGSLLLNKKISTSIYPSWNFGPYKINCKEVINIIKLFYKNLSVNKNMKIIKQKKIKEANFLSLNINKAKNELKWKPRLTLNECVKLTADWYSSYYAKKNIEEITNRQIDFYFNK